MTGIANAEGMDATNRFTNRVADYVGYRPGYPLEMVPALAAHVGLGAHSAVADIGSGTGISAELLLTSGCVVYGVEPNDAMRSAAEKRLRLEPRFRSLKGTAEATGLPEHSVDLVTAAQAFHWFDIERSRAEFRRVLRPDGKVALFWNIRLVDGSPFLAEYEQLMQEFGVGYAEVNALTSSEERVSAFFGGAYLRLSFDNHQDFDYNGLRGRLLSSSYAPPPDHVNYVPMLVELRKMFDRHNVDGMVRFLYRTDLFMGDVGGGSESGSLA